MRQLSILLDVGHGFYDQPQPSKGPYDPGAISPHGWHEFQLNMITAIAASESLQNLGHRVRFVPFGLSLIERGLMAGDFDAFISIHHNASPSGQAQGAEVAVHAVHATETDRRLAASIAKRVAGELGIRDRGIAPLRLAVLSGARRTNVRAAVLTEGFFMDQRGVSLATLLDWARREGYAIAEAVDAWLKA